jgi:hypothetical protein
VPKSIRKTPMNFKILQIKHNTNGLNEFFNPESRLNCRIMDKKPIEGGSVVVVGLLPENDPKGQYIGYDTMICRGNRIPKTEDWGVLGWSWLKYETAKKQFDGLFSNGYKKGLTIDRIDSNGNYEPSNCHWITASENSRKANHSRKNNRLCRTEQRIKNNV